MAARAQSIGWLPALLALPVFLLTGILAGIEPKLGILAALAIIFVLVALTDLAAALVVLIIVVFAETSPLAGPALSATKATGLLLTVGWFVHLATHPRGRQSVIFATHPVFTYILTLFLSWITVSIVWADSVTLAVSHATDFLLVALLYVIVFTAITTRRQAMYVIGAFVAGTTITAAYGIVVRPDVGTHSAERLVSTVADPNFLAAILIAGIALAIAGFFATRGKPLIRLCAATALVLCLIAFVLTGSRGGILGLGIALIAAVAFAGPWRGRMAVTAVILTVFAAGYYTLYAPPELTDRLNTATQGEVSQRDTRTTIWRVAWRMAVANPIHGVGIGNFEAESIHYVIEPGTTFRTDRVIDEPGVSHNTFLGPLAELGIVGLSLFIAIICFSISCGVRAAWQFARNGDPPMEVLSRGLVIATIGMLAAGFFISAEANKFIWLMMAMGPALLAVARSGADEPAAPNYPRALS